MVFEQGYVNRKKNFRRYEICDSNDGDYEDDCLLGGRR